MAQSYIITSFKHRVTNAIYRLDPRSGSYFSGAIKAHLNDFICNEYYIVNSILNKNKSVHVEFEIGDQLLDVLGRIIGFKIINKDIIIILERQNNLENTIRMANALKKPKVVKEVTMASPVEKSKVKDSSIDKFETVRKSIEKAYNENGGSIRLEKLMKKRKEKSVFEFLVRFFTELNNEKDTIFVNNPETVQTGTGRRRSLGDIYMICKYYFPKTTLEEVIKCLYVDLPAHFNSGFRTMNCRAIHKRVWHLDPSRGANIVQHSEEKDEYGHACSYYLNKLKA